MMELIATLALHIPSEWLTSQKEHSNHWDHDSPNQLNWDDITDAQMSLLQEHNRLDLELYAFARKLAARQLEEWRSKAQLYRMDGNRGAV